MKRGTPKGTEGRKLLIFGERGTEGLLDEDAERVVLTPQEVRASLRRVSRKARDGDVLVVVTGDPSPFLKQSIEKFAHKHGFTVVGGAPAGAEAPRARPRRWDRPARRKPLADTAYNAANAPLPNRYPVRPLRLRDGDDIEQED